MYRIYSEYAGIIIIDFSFDTLQEVKRFLDTFCNLDEVKHCFTLNGYDLKIYNTKTGYFIGNVYDN